MEVALLQRFHPEEFHRRFLDAGVRADGRAHEQRRPAQLQPAALAGAFGSSSVRLGGSSAVAGVRAEITEVPPDSLDAGKVVVTVEFPPLCSSLFRERHSAAGLCSFLGNSLSEVLNSTHVVDPAKLCIKENELCWTVNVHVVCLNYDGNAFDMCLLAAVAALEDTVLPALVEETEAGPRGLLSGAPRLCAAAGTAPQGCVCEERVLALKSRPMPVSFAQLPGDSWVVDPSAGEEALGASVSLCLVAGRWLVYHRGGGADAQRFLSELMPLARGAVPAMEKLLDGARKAAAMAAA